jgi:hypothetical protein
MITPFYPTKTGEPIPTPFYPTPTGAPLSVTPLKPKILSFFTPQAIAEKLNLPEYHAPEYKPLSFEQPKTNIVRQVSDFFFKQQPVQIQPAFTKPSEATITQGTKSEEMLFNIFNRTPEFFAGLIPKVVAVAFPNQKIVTPFGIDAGRLTGAGGEEGQKELQTWGQDYLDQWVKADIASGIPADKSADSMNPRSLAHGVSSAFFNVVMPATAVADVGLAFTKTATNILKQTGFNRAQLDALSNLEINPTEAQILEGQQARNLVIKQANIKAGQILEPYTSAIKEKIPLPKSVTVQMDALGRDVATVGSYYGMPKPQPTFFGEFARKIADAFTAPISSLGDNLPFHTIPNLNKQYELPGYRRTAEAGGINIKGEPVGFGENVPETLPQEISVQTEAKAVGAKRIAPDRVAHQQLSPEQGISSLIEKAKTVANNNSASWLKAVDGLNGLIQKYGEKIPLRTEENLKKYPGLLDDFYKYSGLKSYAINPKSLTDMRDQFLQKADRVKWTPEKEQNYRSKVETEYKDLVKKDISKGYKYPQAVLDYDKSFQTAVDNRERYEKGLRTSFSSDDSRIVFEDMDKIGAGMKRQDGKPITDVQKAEIKNGVIDFANELGIDMKKLAENERWVYVHLNGKNPFLMKMTAGLYRLGKDSVSISVGGVESFDEIIDGKKVRKTVNTTMAHELGHALDFKLKNKLFDTEFLYARKNDFNRFVNGYYTRGAKYWKSNVEVTARMIEEYVAIKKGQLGYFDREGYWNKDIFDKAIKPVVENAINKHFSEYRQTTPIQNTQPTKSEQVNLAAERAKAGEVFGPRNQNLPINDPNLPKIDQAITNGDIRIVRRGNADVYQYKNKKGDWISAKDQDTALEKLNAPSKVPTPPKEKVYAPQDQAKLDGVKAQLENVRERLKEHPAVQGIKIKKLVKDPITGEVTEKVTEKNLLDFINQRTGQFEDFKNPNLAETPAEAEKIKAKNALITRTTENAFDSNPELSSKFDNPDTLREVIADYKNTRDVEKTLVSMRNDLEQNLVPLQTPEEIAKQTLRNEKDIAIEARRKKLEAAQKKVNEAEAQKQDKIAKLETERLKPNTGRKLNTLNPKSSLDPETQKIFEKFSRTMNEAKIVGLKYANQMPEIDKLGAKAFYQFEDGVAPFQWEIRQKFDNLYRYARQNGFDELGYEDKYLPHVYENTDAQIKAASERYLEKQGMTPPEIKAYMEGKKLSPDQSMHLKLNPFFIENRLFKTYQEAAEFGLSPRFQKMSDLLGHYEKLLLRTAAARTFIEDLSDAGKIAVEQAAPNTWQPIKYGPQGIKGYWASPKIGNFLDGIFRGHENMGMTDTIMSAVAEASRFGQNIALSAGIPYTPVNFFTAGQIMKEVTRGNLKTFKDFIISTSDKATVKSLQNDYKYIEMMARNGIPFRTVAGVVKDNFETIKTKWGKLATGVKQSPLKPSSYSPFFEIVGQSMDNVFGKKTFENFMPLLNVQIFKGAYTNLIKQGVADELAQVTATRMTMVIMGITEDLGRSALTQDKLTAVFFAPVYRESIVNVLLNIPKAMNPVTRTLVPKEKKLGQRSQEQKWQYQYHFFEQDSNIRNPMYRYSRHLLAGLVVAFGAYNLINKKLTGHYTWENPQGHEADIMIPLPNGQIAYFPFMPGFLAMPRSIIGGTKGILAGDVNQAFEQYGSVFSMVVKTGVDVLTNTNYFGDNIYQPTDLRAVKIEKVAKYVGLEFNHAYVKELINQLTDNPKPLYQSIIIASELPIKFTTQAKIDQGKFYDLLDKNSQANKIAQEPVQKIYDKVQQLIKEGGHKDEILALVKDFTPDQIDIYKNIISGEKTKTTTANEQRLLPIAEKVQQLIKEGKKAEVLALVKDFTDEDKKAFKLIIKKLQ